MKAIRASVPRRGSIRTAIAELQRALASTDQDRALRTPLAYLALIVGGAVLVALRQRGVPSYDSIWAEDGAVFLADAVNRPLADVLLEPYSGYALVVPRLVAELASLVPLDYAALVLSGGAALVVATLAAFVFRASTAIPHPAIRLGLAATVLLLPIAAREGLNSIANLHWWLLAAVFWALAWLPHRWYDRLLAAVVVTLAGLSGPLAILLAPVAGVRLMVTRRPGDHIVTVAWLASAAVQGVVMITSPAGGAACSGEGGLGPGDQAKAYAARVVALNLLGLPLSETVWAAAGQLFPVAALVACLGCGAYLALRRFPTKPLALAAITCSVLLFFVAYSARWCQIDALGPTMGNLSGSRYLIAPALLVLFAVALALPYVSRRTPLALALGAAVGVALALSSVTSFTATNGREDGPSWGAALAAARTMCADGGTATVAVPISPPGWVTHLPCPAALQSRR